MNENNNEKRREWVKNAIIIFLVVMLLLTFFSNTIMNYSLPEVAAQYAKSSTISEQIRGSGNVEASELYDVRIDESRVISSVNVKVGDKIEKGQVLFTLEDSESTELKTAQDKLDTLNLEYKKALLKSTGNDYSLEYMDINNVSEDIINAKDDLANISVFEKKYEKAKKNTSEKKDLVTKLTRQDASITEQLGCITSEDYSYLDDNYFKIIDEAQKKYASAEKYKKECDENVKTFESKVSEGITSDKLLALSKAIDLKEAEINGLRASYFEAFANDNGDAALSISQSINSADIELKYMRQEYSDAATNLGKANQDAASLRGALIFQKRAIDGMDKATQNRLDAYNTVKKSLKEEQNKVKEKLNAANDALADAEEEEAAAKAKASLTVDEAEKKIRDLERSLEEKKLNLAQKQKDDVEASGVSSLELNAKKDEITKLEDDIQKLKDKTVGASIKAQVGGVLSQLNCTAGKTTTAGDSLATIEMTELGYTLSITVTNEQAKKIKVGDVAEVQYFWYGTANVKVQSIKPDTVDPTKNKIVTFSVTGDVEPGMTLQIAMGGKGQNYECVIPNSAIREDNNGKFVLAVVAKSSPLGNRYIAERIDIEVAATDGTYSAVTGSLYGSEFVITTSSKPIEAGKQVRMAAN